MAPAPPRGRKRLGALLILPLVLLAGLALAEAMGWPFLRAPIESRLARELERSVRIGEPFRLHLLGRVRVRAGELWIAAPEGFDAPHLVQAEGLAMALRYRDLSALRRGDGLRIAEMSVDRLDAHLLRGEDGRSTWQGPRREAEPPSDSPPPAVERLVVGSGQVILRDAKSGADLVTRFETREGEAAARAESHLSSTGRYAGKPLRGELSTPGLLPLAEDTDAPLPARGWIEYGGVRIEFDGSVTEPYGERRVKGRVDVSGPSLAVLGELVGAVLPTSPPFRIEAAVDGAGSTWQVQVEDAHIGKSQLAGDFRFDASGPRPRLTGELRGRRLMLADLAPAFGTRSPEGRVVAPRAGRALPDRPLDLPALRQMDAAVAVNLAHLDLGSAFAQPIAPFRGRLGLEQGRLALTDITADTARGSLSGSVAVEADRERWQADLAWRGIRLEDWIKASRERRAAPGDKPPPPYFTGHLQGRAKLAGRGRSTAQLLGSLEGEGTVFVREGSLSHLVVEAIGLDVAQGLGLLLAGDEDLPLRCAVLDFTADQGRVTPRVAVLDTPVTLVQIDGSADLARERLDLRVVARPRNVSPLTLRSPLRVRGSFVDPQVSVQPGPIAARVAGGLLLGAVNPLAAILPFLDPGEKSQPPCDGLQVAARK